jgi:ATP-dependent helicase HrpB
VIHSSLSGTRSTGTLPVDALLPEILANLRRSPNLVIEAAPGAGKTTRAPPALLSLGGDVLVLEPRRIAARMSARRVAGEMGQKIGETVGYQVRFEDISGPKTRLRFLTEGVLTRRMVTDPELRGVGAVVLDEFHERHLETDLALALLRRLQKTKRPDLRIVVMSATLDAGPVRAFLGDCPGVKAEGRLFETAIAWTPYSAAPLEEQVGAALDAAIVQGTEGDVLVFLPGAAAIHRAARVCEPIARRHNLLVTKLFGDLSPAEQDLALEPSARRKVILATNIAESSITIDGVRVVIDSGLARVANDSPWTGLPSLDIARVSKSSSIQRAGRAGRTAPGHVIRLYTAEDFHRRADHDEPEITRRELSQMCLQLESMGVHDPLEMEWLTPPPGEALRASEALLDRLRARGAEAAKMARMPLHPRLSRLILDAEKAGAGDAGCRVAALLSSGQRVRSADLFTALGEERDQRTRAVYDQLRRYLTARKSVQDDIALAKAVMAAFPDRVGRRRPGGVVLLSNGSSASLPPEALHGEYLVAIDIEESRDRPMPILRLACAIEPEWLIDVFPDRVVDWSGAEWNRQGERVEAVSALLYDGLVIEETRGGAVDDEAAAKLLSAKAAEEGLGRFVGAAELEAFLSRVEFASEHSTLKRLDESDIRNALEELCYGLRSLGELERASAGLLPALERKLDTQLLEQIAPARLRLAGGRNTKVNYSRGKAPWVASRLQDFFGMTESPRIAKGKVPLVIHLLAPNQRPVQTTTDLAGSWQRLYPQLRRELGRRYPRHAWPENPV